VTGLRCVARRSVFSLLLVLLFENEHFVDSVLEKALSIGSLQFDDLLEQIAFNALIEKGPANPLDNLQELRLCFHETTLVLSVPPTGFNSLNKTHNLPL
jgi:hypothetical protein